MLYWSVLFWFFFFKQKTAYEMRISDWSSDVCSSDLPGKLHPRGPGRHRRAPHGRARSAEAGADQPAARPRRNAELREPSQGRELRHARRAVRARGVDRARRIRRGAAEGIQPADRKSVVSGMSVSVSVYTGGGRNIYKTKEKIN